MSFRKISNFTISTLDTSVKIIALKQLMELTYKVLTKFVDDDYDQYPELRKWGRHNYIIWNKINELGGLIKNAENFTLEGLDSFLKEKMFNRPDSALQNAINNLKGDLKLQKSPMNKENDTDTTDTLTKFLIKKDLLGINFSYFYSIFLYGPTNLVIRESKFFCI